MRAGTARARQVHLSVHVQPSGWAYYFTAHCVSILQDYTHLGLHAHHPALSFK